MCLRKKKRVLTPHEHDGAGKAALENNGRICRQMTPDEWPPSRHNSLILRHFMLVSRSISVQLRTTNPYEPREPLPTLPLGTTRQEELFRWRMLLYELPKYKVYVPESCGAACSIMWRCL
ncbi:hypothetical protein MRX96_006160 [Rhipicephalus microplus]